MKQEDVIDLARRTLDQGLYFGNGRITRAIDSELVKFAKSLTGPLEAEIVELKAALTLIMRAAEGAKVKCGSDPESPDAIRNGALASIAAVAAQGLGLLKGPKLSDGLEDPKILDLQNEVSRLREGIKAITKIQPPAFSNLSETQVLAMSPSKLIEHCNSLLDKVSK